LKKKKTYLFLTIYKKRYVRGDYILQSL